MRALLLALALLSQVKVAGVQSVPAYSLAKLTATNATDPLSWSIYKLAPVTPYTAGKDLVLTASPGSYLVVLKAANGSSTWQIQFTEPGNLPNPGPDLPPVPQPIPSPPKPTPQPMPDAGGFIYPPETTGFATDVSRALQSTNGYKAEEASAMSGLYSFIARKIALDGQRRTPGLKTLGEATALVKSEEAALLTGTSLRSLKAAFPEVSKIASAEFAKQMGGEGDALTPRARQAYVEFLQLLASGFDQAVSSGRINSAVPRPAQ